MAKSHIEDIDYMSDLRAAIVRGPRFSTSLLLFAIVGFIAAAAYWTSQATIPVIARGEGRVIDITGQVQAAVRDSGVRTGQAALLVKGSTAALTTLEYEPGLVDHDIATAMERIAPRDARYEHEETWHDDNGHSHVRASTVGPSLALPIVSGEVPLGTWQQIVLMDFDTRARRRTIHLSVVGVG